MFAPEIIGRRILDIGQRAYDLIDPIQQAYMVIAVLQYLGHLGLLALAIVGGFIVKYLIRPHSSHRLLQDIFLIQQHTNSAPTAVASVDHRAVVIRQASL
jgi:hypothetical protein